MQVSFMKSCRSVDTYSHRTVIYYASNVFKSLGLTEGTIALLATGVTGVVFIVSTVPAMVSFGRSSQVAQLTRILAHH